MRFKIEGKEYDWDNSHLSVKEAMEFKDRASLGIQQLNTALTLGDPYATITLVYLAKLRAGEAVRWQDLLTLDIATYEVLPEPTADDGSDESEPEDAPKKVDPTSRGGRTRKPATAATT